MSISEMSTLSKHELLEMEKICDGYEADQRLSQSHLPLDVQPYLLRANALIQPLVQAELERIQTEWNKESATQRMADSTKHGKNGIGGAKASNGMSKFFLQSQLSRRFRLIKLLGQGSAGCVWKAFDQRLNRLVAIKVPHANSHSASDHFLREARAASRLNHPNIVRILEVGQEQETCFLLSELIEGESLANRLAERQFTIGESVDLLIEIAVAIEYAHSMGIVHRDLKPHNVLISNDGTTKLFDFGLAKDWNDDEATLTLSGTIVGTPAYMSPEQAIGGGNKLQPSTDIYSFGVIIFQLLTGDVPFRGSPQIVLFQVLNADPPSPLRMNQGLPIELNTLCLKCLEKAPADRFQTAREICDELIRFRDGHPIHSKAASAWSITKKWIRGNRRLAAWIASTCLMLLSTSLVASIAAVVVTRSWQSESGLRLAAQISANAANRETQASREIVQFLESMLHSSDPINAILMGKGNSNAEPPISKSQLDSMNVRLHNELAHQPTVQARLLDGIANVYRAHGDFSKAQMLLDEATKKRDESGRNGLVSQISSRDSMLNTFYKGWLEHDQTHFPNAEKHYRIVLDQVPHSSVPENQLFRADVLFQLGRLLLDEAKLAEALPIMEESLRIRTGLLPVDATPVKAAKIGVILSKNHDVNLTVILELAAIAIGEKGWSGKILWNYGGCVLNRNCKNYAQADKCYALLLGNLQKFLSANHPVALLALGDYAGFLMESGDYRKAMPIAKELIAKGNAICPEHRKLVDAKLKFASELMYASNFSEAFKLYEEVAKTRLEAGQFPEEAYYGLTRCLRFFKKPEQALIHAKKLWEHREGKCAFQVAWCAYTYARALQESGMDNDAKIMDQRALTEAVIELHFPKEAISLERLAMIHAHNGDLAEAEKLLSAAVKAERRERPATHPHLADRLSSLAENLIKQHKTDNAYKLLTESLAIRQKSLPMDDVRIEQNIQALKMLAMP